ncbi:hypothetical protein [Nonomuraea sp. B1E8]|uniref:hypothetical protein n=1 Tax=unclassified Nonomuraea TaxID=2593643 RepID=UPI00325DF868
MANLVYKRVSTDQQSTSRQNLALDEAGIEDPIVFSPSTCRARSRAFSARPAWSPPSGPRSTKG